MIHATFDTAGTTAPPRPADQPFATLHRLFVPLALLLTAMPLMWPTVPPLVDLLNHMSIYRIGADIGTSPNLHRWFEYHWVLVGNLGVNLSVAALAPLIGLEPAVKLVVMAIPVITVAGMALIARETHGRVPATAAFGFVFAYNWPLNFGFVNFCLSVGLAFLAFGLWLRLGRLDRIRLRTALFVPIGFAVWLSHACGWGMLGVMIFAAAFMERRIAGANRRVAFGGGVVACLPLGAALVPMLLWVGGGAIHNDTDYDFSLTRRLVMLMMALKNDVSWIDVGSACLVWIVAALAIPRRDLAYDRRLAGVAIAMLIAFALMPKSLIGSGFSDLRVAPYALALVMLAFAPTADTRFTRALSVLAIAFFVGRMGYQAVSYARLDSVYARQLEALDHLPRGSRVFGLARMECIAEFKSDRLDHVNRLAIVRRDAFTNDTWPATAAQVQSVKPEMIAGYRDLDSQKLLPEDCGGEGTHLLPGALAALPRDRYDYLWLIGVPPRDWPKRDWLRPVWRNDATILYRIAPMNPSAPPRTVS